jgi:hypothetical protein
VALVTVGLRCTERALIAGAGERTAGGEKEGERARLRAVLLVGGGGDDARAALSARLPALAAPGLRLVALRSAGAERRLAVALGVPRVGVLGLAEGLVGVEALLS